MRITLDKVEKGYAMVFDGPYEIVEQAAKHHWKEISGLIHDDGWSGRKFRGWDELLSVMHKPWREGIEKVNRMLERMRTILPPPMDRKRKGTWGDEEGIIDPHRLLAGDDDYRFEVRRRIVHAPMHVALLANLDAEAGDTPEKIFWRGGALIAANELLEAAGYTVEMWMWCLGYRVYPDPNHRQFTTCKLKNAGDDCSIDKIINSLSAWFLRTAVFGSFKVVPTAQSVGGADYDLKPGWRKYMDVTHGVREVRMPAAMDMESAIEAGKAVLAEATKHRNQDHVA